MHQPGAMRLVQAFADFDHHLRQNVERERTLGQTIGQRLAFEVLHHQIAEAILHANIVEVANIRMADRRDGPCLAIEALFRLARLAQMRRQNFDRDRAPQPRIARAIHFAHAAGAQRRFYLVRSIFRSGGGWHAWALLLAQQFAELRLVVQAVSRSGSLAIQSMFP